MEALPLNAVVQQKEAAFLAWCENGPLVGTLKDARQTVGELQALVDAIADDLSPIGRQAFETRHLGIRRALEWAIDELSIKDGA
jgi:hypothetical protein